MAARLHPKHQDEIRAKIQASQLVNVLQNHGLGKKGFSELSASRLRAIEILLRKSVPDLSSIELSGPDGATLALVRVERLVVDERPAIEHQPLEPLQLVGSDGG